MCFSNSFCSLLIINNAIFFIQEKKNQGKQSKKNPKKIKIKKESKEQIQTYLLKPFKPKKNNLQLPTTHPYTAPRYVFA